MKKLLFGLAIALMIVTTGCSEKTPPFEPSATNGLLGTVRDRSDLEGGSCGTEGIMVQLDNGTLLDGKHPFSLNWADGLPVQSLVDVI